MEQISLDELSRKVGNKFLLTLAVSQRARQIKEGAYPLIKAKEENPIMIALEEMLKGKIVARFPPSSEEAPSPPPPPEGEVDSHNSHKEG